MFRPVNTVGDKLDRGGVNRIDCSFEPPWQTGILVGTPETRVVILDMGQHIPEECLGHIGVSYAVRMREAISARRCCTANGGQDTRMIT